MTATQKWTVCVALLALLSIVACAHVDTQEIHTPAHFASGFQDVSERIGLGMAMDNKAVPEEERNTAYWINAARAELQQRAQKRLNLSKAKNIIMFLGDGMSLTTLTAARILKGQRNGKPGEEQALSFEKFPYTGLSKTYCTNAQVADSACTSTAYLCGIKANTLTLGVNAHVNFNNCSEGMNPAHHVSSLAAWAQAAGKSTGIITTTTLTHASPAGAYAHTANRLWESDADIHAYAPDVDTAQCSDIAKQLIMQEPGRNFDIMLGGGMGKFLPNTIRDMHGNMGERADNLNLLSRWQGLHPRGLVVKNREQLQHVNVSRVSNILGLFQSKLMDFHLDAEATQPTLSEMTEVALKLLKKNKNGFFVFIEGGLIDYGNHYNRPKISLDETLELDKAVQLARSMTDPSDTLIVVTSDHAHPLSISGYPERGNDILGLNNMGGDSRGVPYATLNYAVGQQQYLDDNGNRIDLTGQMSGHEFQHPSYVNANLGVHAGDDVGVFASGPHEHLFSGSMQQNLIPHMMAYAACVGNGPKMCDSY